ncbi:major outer membrane protein [Aliarcobacter cryaerophilus]|uniref:Major outer membrane protein n=2 Tax=unclassified Arcobacter TaxID=2593671 RepID=A0AA96CNJ6_9BACT|nr:major outer membrane protein [Arcobacter sp. AZ-2023]WPD09348.1 major outer membrane protein [Arcobacter sp. DSM 115954]WNL14179.1 major outer membrane protein [Arcobacter sp. AZ-2023]WNL19939.1 major outer membrane protein [Arcobacter sp. AZ-2023]WNL22080.1 major outer membrane protein [Arcobacter sp. AZ-2023]
MRKISKISLVAAVAVAGFSTANAQPLEEAIKNVDVSGSVVYRYDNIDDSEGNATRTDRNRYKIGLNLSSKVNDYVKFNSRFIVGQKHTYDFVTTNARKDGVGGTTDGSADVSLSQAYFGFTAIPNTVVNIGKQGLTTPYTVATDINGNEQSGTGILALSTFGPVTAGAGYFNNQNIYAGIAGANSTPGTLGTVIRGVAGSLGLNGGEDLYVATVQGDLDFVKLESWYLGAQDVFNSYTFAANGKIDIAENANLGLEARYVNLKLDNEVASGDDRKNSMFRLAVDGKVSIVNARLAYTQTGKDGGLTAVDQDAKNTSLGWFITSNGVPDAKYWQAALGADILDNLNFTLNYGNLKTDLDNSPVEFKLQEVYGQLTYKMSKNLTTYLRYGTFEEKINSDKNIDQNAGRLQVAYTF